MRQLVSLLSAGALLLMLSSPAIAATVDFEGTFTLTLGALPSVIVNDTGVATVTFSSGTHINDLALPSGFATASTTIPLTDPNNIELVTLIGNTLALVPATLKPISGGGPLTARTMPIVGTFKLCFLTTGCSAFLSIPLQDPENAAIGAGIGGLLTVNGFGKGTHISVINAAWTVSDGTFTSIFTTNAMVPGDIRATQNETFTAFAHGPASGSSTANTSGVLLMVNPARVLTNLKSPSNILGLPISLRLHFLPEPGLLALLGSGVAGLALLGRSRLRR